MAKQRYKRVDSGRLIQEILYTAVNPSDPPKTRAERSKLSSAARQKLNNKCSWMALKRILALNFSRRDMVATLTFSDNFIPRTRQEARAILKAFFAQLRQRRRQRGATLLYVYAIEGFHPGGRPHYHVVINGTKRDYAEIRELWTYGTNLKFETIQEYGYEELARYLSKEAREFGRGRVGDRSWVCSRNIERPVATPTEWVPETHELNTPKGATNIKREVVTNEWGRYEYLEYLLPGRRKSRPKNKKESCPQHFPDLEQCIINERGRKKSCNRKENMVKC